ncbi:hypothetical protein ACGFRG_02280 [Streptomyces sp. NPDC048696]|uniref:hypothetical protein n=1 Tax=Streptomyces sp. NPDC048696 TaxID=3365585 RepID=UPI00371889C0
MRLGWTAATAHVLLLSSVVVAADLSVAHAQPVPPAMQQAAASRSLPDFVYRGVNLWPKEPLAKNPAYESSDRYTEPNPERAFKEGMHGRLADEALSANFSIERHLQGGERNISPYISTTEDLATAKKFALGTGNQPAAYGFEFRQGADGKVRKFAVSRGIVYIIKPTSGNMVYVADAAQREGVADKPSVWEKFGQREWAAFRKIDPRNIHSAQVYERVAEVDESGKIGTWSEAAIARGDFTVDGKQVRSLQVNDAFDANHPGFLPARMPCSPSGSGGRAKRSVNLCGTGAPVEEKPSGEASESLESLESRQVEKVFGELAGKYALKVVARDGKTLSPADVHARIRQYTRLSPQAKATLRAGLKSAAGTAKGALVVAGGALWAKGVYDAFAEDTSSLDKAAALTAIVPFVGCGTQAAANSDHGRFDADDTAACFGADALLVTPLWPAGLTLHGARYFTAKWQEAQIPSITVFQKARDEAWGQTFADFRGQGLAKLVASAAQAERQQVEAEKAVVLHNAAEKIAEIQRGGASDAAKRLLTRSAERAAENRIDELPQQVRQQFDTAIRDALVERARQYNEEFIKQEVDIDRWKDESWQATLHGPSHSRADRQAYLDKLVQRLRDADMLPPVPDAKTLAPDIARAREALATAAGGNS